MPQYHYHPLQPFRVWTTYVGLNIPLNEKNEYSYFTPFDTSNGKSRSMFGLERPLSTCATNSATILSYSVVRRCQQVSPCWVFYRQPSYRSVPVRSRSTGTTSTSSARRFSLNKGLLVAGSRLLTLLAAYPLHSLPPQILLHPRLLVDEHQ